MTVLWAFAMLAFEGFTCAPALGAQVEPDFTVREVWSTEGKEIIADGPTFIRGLVETSDGGIWMVDKWQGAGRVLRLDPGTMKAIVVGREGGEGPGEVRLPAHMTITPDGRVAVLDRWRSRIEIYESSGEPFRRVQLSEPLLGEKGFAALASGGYVLTGYIQSTGDAVHHFDENGRRDRGWRKHPPVPGSPPAGSPWRNDLERNAAMAQLAATGGWIHALTDGSFLYSQAAPHEIVLFTAPSTPGTNWVERTVASMPALFEAPGLDVLDYTTAEDGQTYVGYDMTWPRSMGVFEMSNGYILNIVVMEQEGRSLWQVFEPLGATDETRGAALVMEASVDRTYIPWFLCENDDVLATVTDPATGVDHAVRLRLNWSASRPAEGLALGRDHGLPHASHQGP